MSFDPATTLEQQSSAALTGDICAHRLFEAQAERTPEAIAVDDSAGRSLTYQALNEQANRLGHHLQALGVGPEVLVAICAERSAEMVVAMLGVLKAGGAYLPLDPAYPQERLAYMLADSQASVLLIQQRLVEWLPARDAAVVLLNAEQDSPAAESAANVVSRVTPANLAYVIYTSGSTGQPKGVQIEHRSLANLIRWHRRAFAISPADRTTQVAGSAFDASVWELWPYLAAGASVHVVDEQTRAEPERLRDWLIAQEITISFLPTPLAESVLALDWPQEASLRLLLTGGDQLHRHPLPGLPFELINNYGPTEATVVTTSHPTPAQAVVDGVAPSIGRPIDNSQVYLLDGQLQPTPTGAVGELYIAGAGLARGYLQRPALTAARFIPNPFGGQPGARLYRTGDLARYRPDGSLEFLGRIDRQVKIRGFRIELGEIEVILSQYPHVQQAVVAVRGDGASAAPSLARRLVAYVVPRPDVQLGEEGLLSGPFLDGLRRFLRERLPDYMVPAAFVVLASLPLTANGKIDRQALPAPPPATMQASADYTAPRTPVETALADTWREILGLEGVRIDDNFFDLGGHSLLATQILSRLRRAFEVDMTLHAFFEEPTIRGLAGIVDSTRPGAQESPAPSLTPTPREGDLPLSFAQQRLWFMEQYEPNSPIYNVPGAFHLTGRLDVATLERALSEIVGRHETLRTTFAVVDGKPVQVIQPSAPCPVAHIDLRGLDREEQQAALARHTRQEARRPFDLSQGPLLRATLLQLEAEEHRLLLTMHHVASDDWSLAVLFRELAALYEAHASGREQPLPELPVQYADFAHWQRRWLLNPGEEGREPVLEGLLAYWRQQLAAAPALLELPTDRPRPPVQTFQGASYLFTLSEELVEGLRMLGRRQDATLFMTLLAAFQTLLYRYSGQEDVVVGSPIAGRNRLEIEPLIGFFVNTLVLRTDLAGNLSFEELLERVRSVALGAYAHQELPFERLVEALQPQRSLSHSPLFQVVFAFQNDPLPRMRLPGLSMKAIPVHSGTAKHDLTLFVTGSEAGMAGLFEYNTDLFDAATIARLAGHFQTLLAGIVADPGQAISDLPLLTAAERQQALTAWNDTQAAYPQDRCFHELFEAQVERTPQAIAVVFGQEELTYRQLNERANRLAHHLRRLGVGPEKLVAICMERSPEMIVAMLGVFKAGGAYLPLDPAYPQERLAYMLADSQASVLLTQERLLDQLPAHDARTLCLDRDWPIIAAARGDNPAPLATPANLAYVIYTSGSTGRPKGVVVAHQGLGKVVAAQKSIFGLASGDRVLQLASFSFDASAFEIIAALGAGATLCLATAEDLLPGPNLAQFLHDTRVTAMVITPSALAALPVSPLPALRFIGVAGEACPADLVERWAAGRQFFNLYGPTEATIWATAAPCSDGSQPPPIGRPIANSQVYLLDARQQPVPVGVPGELCTGGVGLARGYLGRPALTAERFIPDPFGGKPGARLYRTGDLARYRPDGNIEFLGRIDHQVKVRGFRIELGEIEAVLGRHPSVQEAVVIAWEGDAGVDKRLVAYVTAAGAQAPAAGQLRDCLAQSLPDYMIPAAFVVLEALPLTPNGKVDRRALPAPEWTRSEAEGALVAPRTPVEEVLAGIWAEVLGIEQVGVHDDFFRLGGHSLLATQALSHIRAALQVETPLRIFFQTPTIAGLAQWIGAARQAQRGLQAPSIEPAPRDQNLPLSFAQQRLWFMDQLSPGSVSYSAPALIRLSGALNVAALESSLAEVVRRHEALRTTFAAVNGQPIQVIHPARPLPFAAPHEALSSGQESYPFIDLSALPEAEREAETQRLAAAEGQQPFDLASGPLLRVTLLRLEAKEHVLFLSMHHIISDGWSMGVFFRELAALYRAFAAGETSPLPELAVQYADFAHWQRRWLRAEVLDNMLAHWKGQLAGAPALLDLPTRGPRPPVEASQGAHHMFSLPPALADKLRTLSHEEGATLFMTLLAAFQALLSRYTGQADISVGSPIANRNRAEIEPLIGFFVNTLVLRTDLRGNPSFRELLGRVRQTTLAAYDYQDMPFEKLVEELKPDRDNSHSPLFQVMFVLQNAGLPNLQLPGLTLSSRPIDTAAVRFDLTLAMMETDEGLRGSLEYNTSLFDSHTIARMAEHFRTLLAGIAANPDRRLADLPLLTGEERQQMLVAWGEAAAQPDASPETTIHALFEAQAAQTPQALAVTCGGERLTYRALADQANQVAQHLRALGVGPETCVALCMTRSPRMIAGLLGILKAGGVCAPLNPAHSPPRLALLARDAQAAVLLTEERLLPGLASLRAAAPRIVCLEVDGNRLRLLDQPSAAPPPSAALPPADVTPDNLAYVTYSAEATARPAGRLLTHRAAASRLQAVSRRLQVTARDVLLAATDITQDTAILEILLPLAVGASLELVNEATASDGVRLAEYLAGSSATIMQAMPATWRLLLAAGWPTGRRLKILCGGERLTPDLAQALLANVASLWNLYGCAEAAAWSTARPVESVDGQVAVGRPLAQTQLYLLGPNLQPVPVGVPGELYIGGAGLARGYLGRPALTAERFIPNPFGDQPGARLYRTGDLARYRPDGVLEFLGRLGRQMIEIRGRRIRLAEVEEAIDQHPAVQEVVVSVEPAPAGGASQQLAAYVVAQRAQEDRSLAASELRRFLRDRLPQYMIPPVFRLLEAMPRTTKGKVDYQALAAHAQSPSTAQDKSPDTFRGGAEMPKQTDEIAARRDQLSDRESQLSARRQALLAKARRGLLKKRTQDEATASQPPVIGRRPPGGEPPLSFAQERLWFLDQLTPGFSANNIANAIRLQGKLDVSALERSLSAIIERHEALRSTFVTVDGRPQQVIKPARPIHLPVVALTPLPAATREAEARRLAEEEARRSFSLAEGPLVQFTLLRFGDHDHVLLLTMHHIVSDGWSMGVFTQELGALYTAFVAGEAARLPELPIQYSDFAYWQRQRLSETSEVLAQQLVYWKKRLGGDLPILALPTDRPRPTVPTYRGSTQSLLLSRELAEKLKRLSQQADCTLFMTLLAAFKVLLHRYTGQSDVLVGSPIANRTRTEIEPLIGFFVNTLVLRSDLSGDPGFRTFLAQVRQTTLEAYAHQDLPFEKLVAELQPQRDLSHTPLFQVLFVLQNPPGQGLRLPDLALSSFAVERGAAEFDLSLYMRETGQGLDALLEYNTDLFDAATVQRLLGHFQTLLAGIVADPGQAISELPLLTAAERQQALTAWNDTQADYPRDRCIHELFEAQVERTPQAIAVIFGQEELTYRQLNERANRLAHRLRRLGVRQGDLVGVCLERSAQMLIGVLGVLKAGGAYVPLDPGYPQERLAYIVADTGLAALLADRAQAGLAEGLRGSAPLLVVDETWDEERLDNLAGAGLAEGLAYVIHTSGSTGRPKGVQIAHRAVVNFLCSLAERPGLTAADRLVAVTTLSFDIAGLELYLPLLVGGRVVIASSAAAADGEQLAALLAGSGATVMQATPATWRLLVGVGWRPAEGFKALCGGEALPRELANELLGRGVALWNMYGPTETTIWSATGRIEAGAGAVRIGAGIANTRIYVLDGRLGPVAVGVAGEMYIGGEGLSWGYLKRAGLTAERFVPDPYDEAGGGRLYRTGDVVRRLGDGGIEFLGRLDHQVKVRGFRIELGEIEAVLRRHPEVAEAVVIVREDAPGDKRLVAYVAGVEGPTTSELRRFVKQSLPDYMTPALFVPLEALPLTPNGKVDRRALPMPDSSRPELESAYVAPGTAQEQTLASIWAELLGLEQVGVHDNFFELGGDSILTIQVVARANQAGLTLAPIHFFQHQTVAELAAVANTAPGIQAEQDLVTGPAPLTPIQQWFFERNLPDPHHFNQAVLLQATQPLNPTLLEQALQQLYRHHDALRLRFLHEKGQWRQVNAGLDSQVALRRVDLSSLPEAQQADAIEATAAELQTSLNLAQGPLMHVAYFHLEAQKQDRILVVVHHLATDGVSWPILLDDLESAYQQLAETVPGPPAPPAPDKNGQEATVGQAPLVHLPPKTTSYRRWAERLVEYAQAPDIASDLEYWRAQFQLTTVPLPTDYPHRADANTGASARSVLVQLSPQETHSLLHDAPLAYNTQIHEVLLTALVESMAWWTGSRVLPVDLEGHGREAIFDDIDLSRTVGWFTSIFPVRLDLSRAYQPGDALKTAKEQLRSASDRGLSYGLLRYLSLDPQIVTQMKAAPRPQVIFNYMGQFRRLAAQKGLFTVTDGSVGPMHSSRGQRSHLFAVNTNIVQNQLRLSWTYSENLHRRDTVERLAEGYIEALRTLIRHCQSPGAGGYTASDFQEAGLDQAELDELLAQISLD